MGGKRLAREDLLTPLEFYFAARFIGRMRAAYSWDVLPVIGAHDLGYCSGRLPYLGMPGERWAGCPAGRRVLGIQRDGRVKACLSPPDDLVVGCLREMPLAELWRGQALAAWRRPVEGAGFCAECPHGAVCERGCTSTAVTCAGRRGDNPCCLYRLEQTL